MEKGEAGSERGEELPGKQPAPPTEDISVVVNHDVMEVDTDSDGGDEMHEDIARFLQERSAAKTVYHARRGDDDTM